MVAIYRISYGQGWQAAAEAAGTPLKLERQGVNAIRHEESKQEEHLAGGRR